MELQVVKRPAQSHRNEESYSSFHYTYVMFFLCIYIGIGLRQSCKTGEDCALFDSASYSFSLSLDSSPSGSFVTLVFHSPSCLVHIPVHLRRPPSSAYPHLRCWSLRVLPEPFSFLTVVSVPGGYLSHL